MKIPCETLHKLAESQWLCWDHLFSEAELLVLQKVAFEKWTQGEFRSAKVGRGSEQQSSAEIRSDSIYWLDLESPFAQSFAQKIQILQEDLNQTLFLGINQFECHFSRYAEGQFYEEHLDQSQKKSRMHGERVISFVLYLNKNWQETHGGQLSLRHLAQDILVDPLWGRIVLFRSDTVPHAVLPSRAERWSLTGWFRRF